MSDDVRTRRVPTFTETPEEIAFEVRSHEGALWTGGRLLIGIWAFACAALAFAYFYLRSANNFDLWRPSNITAPTGLGAAIMAVTVFAAFLVGFGYRRFSRGIVVDWMVAGWAGVLFGLTAIGLQVYQLTQLPFFPGYSGYTSCFIAWASLNIALVLSAIYWLETTLARELRLRRAAVQDGGSATSRLPNARLFRVGLEGCTYFWGFVALVAVFFWVLFYVL
jgi:heme/copper-type cytochrome/quinol oxidase subunit 3